MVPQKIITIVSIFAQMMYKVIVSVGQTKQTKQTKQNQQTEQPEPAERTKPTRQMATAVEAAKKGGGREADGNSERCSGNGRS